jgi:hypothetical protein
LRLEELALTLPPLFAEACGYRGKARHVALCWIPEKGELWWSDDGYATLGHSNAFLILCAHEASAGVLRRYTQDGNDGTLRPWLLVDRNRRRLSVGPAANVWSVIAAQTGERTARRRPPASVERQEELERRVSAWLDWMSKRRAAERSDERGRPSKD